MVVQLALPPGGVDIGQLQVSRRQIRPGTPDVSHHVLSFFPSGLNAKPFSPVCWNNSQQNLIASVHKFNTIEEFVYFNPGLSDSSAEFSSSITGINTAAATVIEPSSLEDEPPATSPEEKKRMFRGYLTTILSCVYAVFLITLGFVIYISDIILGNVPLAAGFNIYLVMFGFIYLLLLYADIRRYQRKVRSKQRYVEDKDSDMPDSIDGNLQVSIPYPSKESSNKMSMPVYYLFSKGRHSGSFYLKAGAAVFCFGHLIHSGLILSYQLVFLTSEQEEFFKCASIVSLTLDIIYPIYSFFQLFFIFKYSHVIINRCKELARFAVMHCIASSLCFWVWTIIRETMDSINSYANNKDKEEKEFAIKMQESLDSLIALPLQSYQQRGAQELLRFINESELPNNYCRGPPQMSAIYDNFSPYLYPFTIEYSILVVGVLYIIWQNIGSCGHRRDSECTVKKHSEQFTSNLVIHADCHSANKGLFAGLIVLVGSVVSIILFFITMADSEIVEIGLKINAVTELILLIVMTIAVTLAYRKLTQLDINNHPISLLDDLLLFTCIPAFFLFAIFSIIPAVQFKNYSSIVIIILQIIQVLLQTPFIIDGLRRCSNTRALRLMKPGRELVTFLVVCNIAMWITETFEIKSHDNHDENYQMYGKVLWTMLKHMTVPLTMFYRFHSSVCLVDIWKSAYERGQ